jgi:hypothetical protein
LNKKGLARSPGQNPSNGFQTYTGVTVSHNYSSAFVCESLRRRLSDPGTGSGNDCRFPT